MNPARSPRAPSGDDRLLRLDPRSGVLTDGTVGDLTRLLLPCDLVVVNDAATFPASLAARGPDGRALEIRLLQPPSGGVFSAVLFGEGDWRTPTERRPPPALRSAGDVLLLGEGLEAAITLVSARSPRLVELRFSLEGAPLLQALYRRGRPVQYAYLDRALALWDVQNTYAARPWAAELPSAGRPLRGEVLLALHAAGVEVAAVTHAAGLSSTGDEALDALLPLPERYDIPPAAARAVARARAAGGRVLAVGTSVVRALEGAAAVNGGELAAGEGVTDLRIRPGFRPRVVSGLLTGIHAPAESHFDLLGAFAAPALLERAHRHAEEHGYLTHEFGDASLILAA